MNTMAITNQQGLISKNAALKQQEQAAPQEKAKQSITALINAMVDRDGYRRRFDELLGARAPQFISSVVSLINAEPTLQQVFRQAPITIIQAALKAATYNLPIDPSLGYAYIVPFNNSKKEPDGSYSKRMEAQFVIGYKGMNQLALRTGAYKIINVVDVRLGELKSYNRLTEEIQIEWVEDEDAREKLPIIGWVGYFRLVNGAEKTIYMTIKQIKQHEIDNRKGKNMGKGWRENFNDMAAKTVFRRLIGKWGLMSIDYQQSNPATIAAAEAIARGQFDDEDQPDELSQKVDTGFSEVSNGDWTSQEAPENVDPSTGEVYAGAKQNPAVEDAGAPVAPLPDEDGLPWNKGEIK